MWLDPNPDAFDLFLATRHGRYIVGVLSLAISMIFLLAGQMESFDGSGSTRNERTVKRFEAVVQRDALLFFGAVALMLGAFYLVWSIFTVP